MKSTPKELARQRARYYVSLVGKLCERCGADGTTERGRLEREKATDVIILCKACHDEEQARKTRVCVVCGREFMPQQMAEQTCGRMQCAVATFEAVMDKMYPHDGEMEQSA